MKTNAVKAGENLISYLRNRASVESAVVGEEMEEFMAGLFNGGVRCFFGIEIDDAGNLLADSQEPYPGFFEEAQTTLH